MASKAHSSLSDCHRQFGYVLIDGFIGQPLSPGFIQCKSEHLCIYTVDSLLEGFVDCPSLGSIYEDGFDSCFE